MSSDNIKYTQVQFIETVLDIANNGWANSIIGEDQKNWVCGRIMSRLPDDWVRAMFQAAVDGINKSDDPIVDSNGNTIPPKNTDMECEAVEDIHHVNPAEDEEEEVCSVTSETKIQPEDNKNSQEENINNNNAVDIRGEEECAEEEEDIDAEDDCAEDAEAQQRRYEAKIDAEDMKLLAEIDAREKAEKAALAKEQENQKNQHLLIEKIKEQNNLGNGNKTLSEIAKMMMASKTSLNQNINNNPTITATNNDKNKESEEDEDMLMFTVKKKRVVSENGADKPTNVIYTPDSVNEGYNYNRKFTGSGRISGKRSFITSEPQFAARDLPVHHEELLANNAINSGTTLNTSDSIAQIDSNYHSKSSMLKSELSPRFKSENLHIGRKQLLKVRQNQIEDIFALQQREQIKNINNNNNLHHQQQQQHLFNPQSNHVISDAPTSNNSHLEKEKYKQQNNNQSAAVVGKDETGGGVTTKEQILLNSAELLSKKLQQQQPLSNNLVRSTDIDPELDANVLLTTGNNSNNNNNNNLTFANSSTKRQLEHILRLKELTKQRSFTNNNNNNNSSSEQNVIIDTVLNPFANCHSGKGLVQSKNTTAASANDRQLNIAIGDNELPIFTETNPEEDKMEKELTRADLLMRENNILMRDNIIRENNLLREQQQQNMMLMNNLESQFQESNNNNNPLFRESANNLIRRDSFQNNNNNTSVAAANSFDLSSRIQQISGFKSVQAEKMKKHASDLLLQQREATNRAFARNVKKSAAGGLQLNSNNPTSGGHQSLYTVQENNNGNGIFKEFNLQNSLNSHNSENINNLSINVPSNNGINSANNFLNSTTTTTNAQNSFQKNNIPCYSGNLGNQPTSAPGGIGIAGNSSLPHQQNIHHNINSNNNSISPDEQIFTCPWPGCGKTFRRKAYVKKHMELHSTHKAYGCDLCEVRCRQYAGLYIHYKGVHKLRLKKHNVRYYPSDHVEGSAFLRLDHTGEPVQRILDDGTEMNLQGGGGNSMLFGN